MQFRFTLSEEDVIERRILQEIGGLNVRRRSEYFRRILAKGFMAELAERDLLNRVPVAGKLSREGNTARDYNEASMGHNSSGGARTDSASSLKGLFEDQAGAASGQRAAVADGGEK